MIYELRLIPKRSTPAAIDVLSAFLLELGMPSSALVEQKSTAGRRQLCAYLPSAASVGRWIARLHAVGLRGVTLRARGIRDADWQDAWKKHLKPFRLARGLEVVPAWSREARRGPSAGRLVLETGLAFGTGKHATTRWMARWIVRLRGRLHDVLDVGLGSGILAMVASRCGASRITGVDISPASIDVSRRNMKANGCRGVRLLRGDFSTLRVPGTFDMVVANIGMTELLVMRKMLIRAVKPGGHLAVTGVLGNQAGTFRREFADRALRLVETKINREWAAFLYRKA